MIPCDLKRRVAYCHEASWAWLAAPRHRPCPARAEPYRPCGRCGHAADEHDHEIAGAGCMADNYRCSCHRWEPLGNFQPMHTDLRTDAMCVDACLCRGDHPEGARYYVSARYGERHVLLLGPYATHGAALGAVRDGAMLAERYDRRAIEYAYGTCNMTGEGPYPEGLLNRYRGSPLAPEFEIGLTYKTRIGRIMTLVWLDDVRADGLYVKRRDDHRARLVRRDPSDVYPLTEAERAALAAS